MRVIKNTVSNEKNEGKEPNKSGPNSRKLKQKRSPRKSSNESHKKTKSVTIDQKCLERERTRENLMKFKIPKEKEISKGKSSPKNQIYKNQKKDSHSRIHLEKGRSEKEKKTHIIDDNCPRLNTLEEKKIKIKEAKAK